MSDQAAKVLQKMRADLGVPDAPRKAKTFDEWIQEMGPALKEALPASFTLERFQRMIITNYRATPGLQECTMRSVLGAAVQAAQLGLMIGILDQAYLVPYRNYKGKENGVAIFEREASLQIGYKGYMELGHRTGKITKIDPGIVYPGDLFDFEYGTNEFIKHKPMGLEEDHTKPTHYYCKVHFTTGEIKFLVKTYNQIQRHAKKYTDLWIMDKDSGKLILNHKSNWYKNPDPMAKKTVIRELFQTIQLTTELMLAISTDGTIKNADEGRLSRNMAEEVIDITNYNAPEDQADQAQKGMEEVAVTVESRNEDPGPVEPGPNARKPDDDF